MDSKSPATVSREELYRQVWEKPMSKLADQYGISGNGLAKICDRLQVPYPPRGYWAKKSAGKRVGIVKLPEADSKTPPTVRIAPTVKPASQIIEDPTVERVRGEIGEILIPQRLSKPHPIIEAWLAERKRQRDEAKSDPWRLKWAPSEFTDSEKRRHRVLDALFKAIEKRGGKISQDDRLGIYIELQNQKIEIQLREKSKQVQRLPTEEEKKYRSVDKKGLIRELQASGRFILSIKTWIPGLRREWLESKDATIEAQIPDIVATLIAAGPILVELENARAEEAHRRHIAEMKAFDERQKRKKEENRWRRFIRIAKVWEETKLAREFIAAIRTNSLAFDGKVDGLELSEWLAWGEKKISDLDPLLCGAEAIFNTVAQANEWTTDN